MIEGLTPGRMVHYVLAKEDGVREWKAGEHRPAIVVAQPNADSPKVHLSVFTAGSNDFPGAKLDALGVANSDPMFMPGMLRVNVEHDPSASTPGTWHWPERA